MLNMSGSHFVWVFLFVAISITVASSKDIPKGIEKSNAEKDLNVTNENEGNLTTDLNRTTNNHPACTKFKRLTPSRLHHPPSLFRDRIGDTPDPPDGPDEPNFPDDDDSFDTYKKKSRNHHPDNSDFHSDYSKRRPAIPDFNDDYSGRRHSLPRYRPDYPEFNHDIPKFRTSYSDFQLNIPKIPTYYRPPRFNFGRKRRSSRSETDTGVKVDTFVDASSRASLMSWAKTELGGQEFSVDMTNSGFELYRKVYDIYCKQPEEKQTASEVKCGSDYSQVAPERVAFHDTKNDTYYDSNYQPLECVERSSTATCLVSVFIIITVTSIFTSLII